jgi:hypothetical protein
LANLGKSGLLYTSTSYKGQMMRSPQIGKRIDPKVIKRLTLEIPTDLHTRIKIEAAKAGVNMADVVRPLLEKEFKLPPD